MDNENSGGKSSGGSPEDPAAASQQDRLGEFADLGENIPESVKRLIAMGGPTIDFVYCDSCGASADERRGVGCMGGGWLDITGEDGKPHSRRCPEMVKLERRQRVERLMESSGIGRLGQRQTFETFDETLCKDPDTREAYRILEALPEKVRAARKSGEAPPKGLLIVGSAGSGKSHLLRATAVRAIADGLSATFVETYRLLARIRESYDAGKRFSAPGESEPKTASEIVEAAASADVMCLDDLGAERESDHAGQTLFELLDTLDASENTLVVSTNLGLDEIAARYGERCASRIMGLCDYIEIASEKDHRE